MEKSVLIGQRFTEDYVRQINAPEATLTWRPVAHRDVLDMVNNSLDKRGLRVIKKDLTLSHKGERLFGVYDLNGETSQGDFGMSIGFRNSNDQRFALGMSAGTKVFVCENLMFNGDVVIKRKHTPNIMRDLLIKIDETILQFLDSHYQTVKQIDIWKDYKISLNDAESFCWNLSNVIPFKHVKDEIYPRYVKPMYREHGNDTVWTLHNAITQGMKPRQARNPHSSAIETAHIFSMLKEAFPFSIAS